MAKCRIVRVVAYPAQGYIIEIKKHWWSKWKIRDWDTLNPPVPVIYPSERVAKQFL